MASSGSFNTTDYDGRYLTFSWTVKSRSIANNTTTISWTLKGGGGNSHNYYKCQNVKVTIDGNTVFYKPKDEGRYDLWIDTVVATGEYTFTHDSNGNKSFTAYAEAGIYVWAVNCIGSKTFTLDNIPRTSDFTMSDDYPEMGDRVTFTIERAAAGLTHKLTLTWGGTVSTIASNVDTSATWTIPLTLAADIPNSLSSGGIITCITYSGSTEIGRLARGITISVPKIRPSIGTLTVSEAVSNIATKFGAYIQSKSKLKIAIGATGANYSTIRSYSTKILNKTYTGQEFTSNTIDSSGSVDIEVTVTDSRGLSNTFTKTITVLAYSDPTISTFTAQRCNSDGSLNDDGEYVKLALAFNITSLSDENTKSYTVAYKIKEDTDFTTLTTGSVYTLNTTYVPTVKFSGDYSYDFILTVTDFFKPVSHIDEIQTAFTLTDYHSSGTGISFGKVAEKEDTFENALELRQIANSYAFQPPAFNGEKGYTLLAVIKINALNVNAPIVFIINRRGAVCPMTVSVKFANSSASTDPDLGAITYEGDNYGVFLVKTAVSTWSLYVDNTGGWSNPCVQKWYTTNNQMSRLSVSFPQEQIESLPKPWYRATPAVIRSVLDCFFSVGSIIIRYDHSDPNTMFPGTTWVRINDHFLLGVDYMYSIGVTGGESQHTLTIDEIPTHTHGSVYSQHADGSKNYAWYTTSGSSLAYGAVNTGEGVPHNNMPPFVQVSIWRRTA